MSTVSDPIKTGIAPLPAPVLTKRRARATTSLAAQGEPWIWLTGGALGLAVIMIIGLLSLVLWQGIATFWPAPLKQIKLTDGKVIMGEESRDEWFVPGESLIESLSEDQKKLVAATQEEHDGRIHRRLIRTANYDLTESHFTWVSDYEVAAEGESRPQWAVTIERMSWGRFYGFPKALEIDGKVMGNGEAETWAKFNQYHSQVRDLFEERRSLEKHDIGKVNRIIESARLTVREAELDELPPPAWVATWRSLNEIKTSGSAEDPAVAQAIAKGTEALKIIEQDIGKPNQAFLEAIKTYEQAQEVGKKGYKEVTDKIAVLNKEMERYHILMTAVDGKEKKLALADVVIAYPANQLGFGGKISIFAERWWEFLTQDPREANSEGGVFPAIFGTVAMTLIMSIAVVPFGVLAALYLREFAKGGLIVSVVRIAINNLAGVPSIVFGVFGLGFLCYGMGAFIDGGPSRISVAPWPPVTWFIILGLLAAMAVGAFFLSITSLRPKKPTETGSGRLWISRLATLLWIVLTASFVLLIVKTPFFDGFNRAKLPSPTFGTGGLLWASMTLALLTLPVVIVATEEALAAVPSSMREGSYACGASKWQTIQRIVLPRALPGIMTGAILAMARGAGEVAPLMLVGAVKLAPELPIDGVFPYVHAERSFMHLGFHIYDLGFQSQNSEAAKPMVFTTTLLLIAIIIVLNLTAITLRTRLRRRFVTGHF